MVLGSDFSADEDRQMPYLRINDVEDPLAAPPDLVHALVIVENPVERLLRRRYVVALRAETDDRRLDLADIEADAVAGHDLGGRELVADKEIVDHPLQFLAAQQHEVAPPLLEMQVVAFLPLRVRPNVVLFLPQCVGGVQIVEIRDQPGGVEHAVAQIAHQAVEPASAEHAAEVAHRVLAVDAAPVAERRTREHNRPNDIRAHTGGHHQVPAGLAVAEYEGLAQGGGMEFVHLLDENRVRPRYVLDALSLHRIGHEADEIHRMTGLERIADLAHRLEATDSRALPGAGVDDNDGALAIVDLDARRRDDAEQRVVDRMGQCIAAHHKLGVVDQD